MFAKVLRYGPRSPRGAACVLGGVFNSWAGRGLGRVFLRFNSKIRTYGERRFDGVGWSAAGWAGWAALSRERRVMKMSERTARLARFVLADPRGPLGLDYRQIPVEHFFVGVFATLGAKAQRAFYVNCGLHVPLWRAAGIS